jgi:hypothetical protein
MMLGSVYLVEELRVVMSVVSLGLPSETSDIEIVVPPGLPYSAVII